MKKLLLPTLLILILGGSLPLLYSSLTSFTAARASFQTFRPLLGSQTPLISRSQVLGATNVQQQISLSLALSPQHSDLLQTYAEDVVKPGSPNYHRFLSPDQAQQAFGANPQEYAQALDYLKSAGFTVTHTYNHHLLIGFSGTVQQAEKAFHVQIQNYAAPDGHRYFAASSQASIPTALGSTILGLSGLNNAMRQQHHLLKPHQMVTPQMQYDQSCPKPGLSYLLPNQVAQAYNLQGLYNQGYHGEGQTVALYELDSFNSGDLKHYSQCFGQAPTSIQTIVTGNHKVDADAGMTEVELDAEMVLSTAPRLANLKIYEAANTDADSLQEWAQIINDAPAVVSNSWGLCEKEQDKSYMQAENQFFQYATIQGQAIFSASGDLGSAGCAYDTHAYRGLAPDDPASQPNVVAVGGTSLQINSSNNYQNEQVWNNSPDGASGGGISTLWQAPSWFAKKQAQTNCHPSDRICRGEPDVSLHADPNKGYLIYCSDTHAYCSPKSPWIPIGGTSAATPIWAAWMAMTNQAALAHGLNTIGLVTPLLYQIASQSDTYAANFHDVTTGNNDYNSYNHGMYPAGDNFDLATGLGSFNASVLTSKIIQLSAQNFNSRISLSSKQWYFAEGKVGRDYQENLLFYNPSLTEDAQVEITCLFSGRSPQILRINAPKNQRTVVRLNDQLHADTWVTPQAVSTIVKVLQGPGLIAERPLYFQYKEIKSGTDAFGTTKTATRYYFPNAENLQQSNRKATTEISLLNPNSRTSQITISYYSSICTRQIPSGPDGGNGCSTQTIVLGALKRVTLTPPMSGQFSIQIASDQPIVAEKTQYLAAQIPSAGGSTTGAATYLGATTQSKRWLFPQTSTEAGTQQNLVLANFSGQATGASLTLRYSNGQSQQVKLPIIAWGRTVVDINGIVKGCRCKTTTAQSAEISSDRPIVAQSQTFFHHQPGNISGMAEMLGEPNTDGHAMYAFAEGYTGHDYDERLTLYNPSGSSRIARVTFFADTYLSQQQYQIPAHSFKTLNIKDMLAPLAAAYPHNGVNPYAVSLTVQGQGGGIIAQRSLFFNNSGRQGGTQTLGYTRAFW